MASISNAQHEFYRATGYLPIVGVIPESTTSGLLNFWRHSEHRYYSDQTMPEELAELVDGVLTSVGNSFLTQLFGSMTKPQLAEYRCAVRTTLAPHRDAYNTTLWMPLRQFDKGSQHFQVYAGSHDEVTLHCRKDVAGEMETRGIDPTTLEMPLGSVVAFGPFTVHTVKDFLGSPSDRMVLQLSHRY